MQKSSKNDRSYHRLYFSNKVVITTMLRSKTMFKMSGACLDAFYG